jgi:hypothetical protein
MIKSIRAAKTPIAPELSTKEPRSADYYAGFLFAVEALSNEKQQAEVAFTPVNFNTLLEMLNDYKTVDERRVVCDLENAHLKRRLEDLERKAPKLYELSYSPPYAVTTTTAAAE